MIDEYDYIIVGAGSAGCVIADRLSADADAQVLLVEAGGSDAAPQIQDGQISSLFELWAPGLATDWGYVTQPQAALGGRGVPIARGKVLGGSSAVNAMMFVRGNRLDFDSWAAAGNQGWSYDDVLPLFRRLESFEGGASELRGGEGPLSVVYTDPITPVAQLLFEAGPEVGLADEGPDFDYNGERQAGAVFRYQANKTRDGHRASSAAAYLHPALERSRSSGRQNLTLLSNATASRIVIENGRATGVELIVDGVRRVVRAQSEVVVSCGSFGSPQLLMLSGIGPQAELNRHALPVVSDLPGVGQNLQDHMNISVAYLSTREQDAPPALMAETGFFTHTSARSTDQAPDLQLLHCGLKFMSPQFDEPGNGFTFAPALLQPYSRGTVSLRSADPSELPLVQPEYLSDSRDVDVFVEGIELSRELVHSRAYAGWAKKELAPGDGARTRADLVDYIRANAATLWHPVGTCAMGTGEEAVVDDQLRVRGVSNLRVADASVMPTIVAGNTNAACVMIGEKAADLIRAARTSSQQEPAHA